MVDPNPARGMPAQLQKYWLVGKGAAKIRWHMPHDFDRCVTNLRKYFPKNPQGLCNILHQKALGAPPGKGHGHSITAGMDDPIALIAAQELMDRQPKLGKHIWAGPLAPIGLPTGEPRRTRVFEPGALYHRPLPLPLDWRPTSGVQGHDGAMTVARILGITYGPDHEGQDYAWGWGDYLDEDIVPESKRARYLAEMGVAGPSVDPGGQVIAGINPATGFEHMQRFGIGGATLVSIPAFAALRQMVFEADGDWPDDDPDMMAELESEEDCGCGGDSPPLLGPVSMSSNTSSSVGPAPTSAAQFTVNMSGWRGLPLAPRESVFDNDDAVKRITAWAQGGQDTEKMRRAFMFYDTAGSPNDPTSYRLPVGDIINGRLTLIFHAIYAAAALLSGAHGGLPNVPETEAAELRNVISEIYPEMATAFNDSSVRAPWDRSAQEGIQLAMGTNSSTSFSSTGFPVNPPKEWFEDPQLPGKTKLTVTDDGHVYGHLAAWNECHRDMAQRECVLAPKSKQDYAPFHLGTVVTAEGEVLSVGKIVMDTRHAGIHLGYTAAAVHYDNTGDEVAVIRCGEDQYGIWFAGAVVPEATPQKVAKLRRSPLSGDWRREKGSLELTAALAVNAPAFPVYAMEDDERMALVAGLIWDEEPMEEVELGEFSWNEPHRSTPSFGIMATVQEYVQDRFASDDEEERRQRLNDLMEDEAIYAQRQRADRLRYMFSVDPGAAPAAPQAGQATAPAPATAPGAAPADPAAPGDGGQSATDEAAGNKDYLAWSIAAQAGSRFTLVKPGIGGAAATTEEATAAPAQPGAPVTQPEAPAATSQTVPPTQG